MTNRNLDRMSRFVAFLLWRRPDAIGVSLDEHGWAPVAIENVIRAGAGLSIG